MKTIYKYILSLQDRETILDLPLNAELLSVACQNDNVCLWVKLDPDEEIKSARRFSIFGTGHRIEVENYLYRFVGTALMNDGALVWHVFETRDNPNALI